MNDRERHAPVVCTARRPIPAGAYCGREHNHCGVHICNLGCCKWSGAEPSDRERLREDVREEIRMYETWGDSARAFRVRAAELRDFYRRTFGEECP